MKSDFLPLQRATCLAMLHSPSHPYLLSWKGVARLYLTSGEETAHLLGHCECLCGGAGANTYRIYAKGFRKDEPAEESELDQST